MKLKLILLTASATLVLTAATMAQTPTFDCPGNIIVSNDNGDCGAVVNYTIPTCASNCSGITITQTDATGLTSGDFFPVWITTLEYTIDNGIESSTCTFDVEVKDNEQPTVDCVGQLDVYVNANCEYMIEDFSIAPFLNISDNCGVGVITQSPLSGTVISGVLTQDSIKLDVIDIHGNSAKCYFRITLRDTTVQPTTACYETATFNTTTCQWDVTGTQPVQPTTACYETATFNTTSCQWDVTGTEPAITIQPLSQTVNVNDNVQLTANSSEINATYQWQSDLDVGFQNINSVGQYSGTTNHTLTVSNVTLSNNNQPFRCIINSGSCSDTSNVAMLTVYNNVGVNEFTQDNSFSVYPNPANSQINVKADQKLLGSVYNIYDNTGKFVLTGKINSETTVIELGRLSGGIYYFSVGVSLKQAFKIIKE